MTQGKRVVVTGAGGFVGRHLCAALAAAGHDVTAIIGPADSGAPAEKVVRADVSDAATMHAAMAGADQLVHTAGPPSVADSFADPALFARVHVEGTAVAMKAACDEGLRSAVYVSSAEVYGAGGDAPVREDAPCQPLSPYGAAKLGAEWTARTLGRSSNMAVTVLRPFSLYGPGMRETSVLGSILRQVRSRGPVELHDLRPVRDYLHVEDFAALVLAALNRPEQAGTFNACSGAGVSVRDLAEAALAASGATADVSQTGASDRPLDLLRLVGSREAAAQALAWAPRISLADGLPAMLRA